MKTSVFHTDINRTGKAENIRANPKTYVVFLGVFLSAPDYLNKRFCVLRTTKGLFHDQTPKHTKYCWAFALALLDELNKCFCVLRTTKGLFASKPQNIRSIFGRFLERS